jgi:hypothetical protein
MDILYNSIGIRIGKNGAAFFYGNFYELETKSELVRYTSQEGHPTTEFR